MVKYFASIWVGYLLDVAIPVLINQSFFVHVFLQFHAVLLPSLEVHPQTFFLGSVWCNHLPVEPFGYLQGDGIFDVEMYSGHPWQGISTVEPILRLQIHSRQSPLDTPVIMVR